MTKVTLDTQWAKRRIKIIIGKISLFLEFGVMKSIVDKFIHYDECMNDYMDGSKTKINWNDAFAHEFAIRMTDLMVFGETRKMKKLAKVARKRGMAVHYFKDSVLVMDRADYNSWLIEKRGV